MIDYIIPVFCLLVVAALSAAFFRDLGYQKGYQDGRKDADNWWIRSESEVDQTRVAIWRKGAKQ